jgi:DNA-binding response OmpR family regulator
MIKSRILILDDNESHCKLMEEILTHNGYQIFKSISDPREARKTCQQFAPDLIILDWEMPYMDGFDVLEDLKDIRNEKNILVMMITVDTNTQIRLKASELGVDDFIVKPVNVEDCIQKIDVLLSKNILRK